MGTSGKTGDAKVQFNLGMMYANGQGVPQDYKTAVKRYAGAQYRLVAKQSVHIPDVIHSNVRCPVGEKKFVSCTLKNGQKKLETCRGDDSASYWFGSFGGKAELALTARKGEYLYRPWPGVSRTIWEELEFENNVVSYTVTGAKTRIWTEKEEIGVDVINSGGVTVSENGIEIAHVECDAGSVLYVW